MRVPYVRYNVPETMFPAPPSLLPVVTDPPEAPATLNV